MEEYSIYQLTPADFDILIPLMKDCFGMNVNIDYFRWKFLQNPSGGVIGFYALSAGGECAAYYGVIAETYTVKNVRRTIYQSCDTMTHSGHRRKGLFQKLATTCYAHLQSMDALFVIGFGGGQSTPGFLKFGWEHLFDVYFHFKPKAICYLQLLLNKLTLPFANTAVKLVCLGTPDEIIELIKKNTAPTAVSLERSTAFIKWRLSNPVRTYRIIAAFEEGKYAGYCIYYVESDKVMLLDAYCPKSSHTKALFNELNSIVIKNGLAGIVTFAQLKTLFSGLLLSRGFFINRLKYGPLHEHLPFIFYSGSPELAAYRNAANWSVTPLDHDAF